MNVASRPPPHGERKPALILYLSDILAAVDRGDFAALVLLDLSAAFDTVGHDILLQRLQTSFGIGGTSLKWFQSYLTSRSQYVRRGTARSTTVHVVFHRAQCLGQFCSSCIQLTWSHSSSSTACRRISTLMTLRFMVQVVHLMSVPCCRRLPDV